MASISLCIITKDNASTLARCLASARSLVDEIILVDTGSTDATKSIAQEYGAKIFDFVWTDNFSEAKNEALSKATGDWILNLDADETLASSDLPRLRALTDDKTTQGYFLIQRNYINAVGEFEWNSCAGDSYEESRVATGYAPRKMLRFFRNLPEIRFEGVVHDSVIPALERLGKMSQVKETTIPIHHFGLLNRSPERMQKYVDLEKQHLKNDYFQEYQIAAQLHALGKLDEAAEHLVKSIQLNEHFSLSLLELAIIGIKKGKILESKPLLVRSLQLQEHPMTWSHLGIIEAHEQNPEKAITCFEKAVALNPQNADLHYNLAQALKQAGKKSRAEQEFAKAAALNPVYKKG